MALSRLIALPLLSAAVAVQAHPGIGIVRNTQGTIYWTDLAHVWERSPDGTTSIIVPNVHTHELYLAPDGTLHGEHLWYTGEATDTWKHYLWKRTPDGRVIKDREQDGFRKDHAFARDAQGTMYWVERDGKTRFYKGSGEGDRTLLCTTDLDAVGPPFCAQDGTVWFVSGNDLYRVAAEGPELVAADLDGVPSTSGPEEHAAMGLWEDADGRIHVALSERREVVRVEADGTRAVMWRSEAPWAPSGGVAAPDGGMWLLEYDPSNQVRITEVSALTVAGRHGEFPWSFVGVVLAGVTLITLLVGLGSRKKAGSALQASMAR